MPSPNLTKALKKVARVMQERQNKKDFIREVSQGGDIALKIIEGLMRKGLDGIDGYTPKKGVDYFTEQEILDFLNAVTPVKGVDYRDGEDGKSIKGDKGDAGYTPRHGIDYFDGEDADISEMNGITEKCMEKHEKKFDHKLIHDSKVLGDYELDTKTLQEGDMLIVKGKKLVGVKPEKQDMRKLQNYVVSQGVSSLRSISVTQSRELDAIGIYIIDASSGNITITLPSAAGRENTFYELIRIDSSSNTVTITPNGSETMSGMTTYEMAQWTDVKLFAFNSNYLLRGAS